MPNGQGVWTASFHSHHNFLYRTLALQKEQEALKIRPVHSEGKYLCIAILHDVIHTGVVLVFPHIDAYMITYQTVLLYPVQ
jgi:hypothetical protein